MNEMSDVKLKIVNLGTHLVVVSTGPDGRELVWREPIIAQDEKAAYFDHTPKSWDRLPIRRSL